MIFSPILRNIRAQNIIDAIDVGASGGAAFFYSAPVVDGGQAISTQTLLATLLFDDPSGVAVGGELNFSLLDGIASASGDIAWVRVLDSSGGWVFDALCGGALSSAPFKLSSTSVVVGQNLTVITAQLIEGNA